MVPVSVSTGATAAPATYRRLARAPLAPVGAVGGNAVIHRLAGLCRRRPRRHIAEGLVGRRPTGRPAGSGRDRGREARCRRVDGPRDRPAVQRQDRCGRGPRDGNLVAAPGATRCAVGGDAVIQRLSRLRRRRPLSHVTEALIVGGPARCATRGVGDRSRIAGYSGLRRPRDLVRVDGQRRGLRGRLCHGRSHRTEAGNGSRGDRAERTPQASAGPTLTTCRGMRLH